MPSDPLLAKAERYIRSAVISAYGQDFARTRVLDPRFHRALLTAFSQRQLGDYAVDSVCHRKISRR
jgi:hypothetical protein